MDLLIVIISQYIWAYSIQREAEVFILALHLWVIIAI